jgi:AcrR family transcriptional regulator
MPKLKITSERRNHKDTYKTIVETAQKLFMELGYRAVSTRQIAELCGITQPALYHHFKNKQTLFVAVNKQILLQTKTDLNEILGNNNTFNVRLKQISLYMAINYGMDLTQMFHDIFHELDENDQQVIHKWWIEGFLMPTIKMIEDGVAQEEIKNPALMKTTSTELAYIILNLIKSILQPAEMKKSFGTNPLAMMEQKANLIVEIFLSGVGV